MVKRIIWSRRALLDRLQILSYGNNRNGNNRYSRKLNKRFREYITLVKRYSNIGKRTNIAGVRGLVIQDYILLYERINTHTILVVAIWDGRQNPDNKLGGIEK